MEAMILAAGLGTRMAPLTDRVPKALVPVRGKPLIEHVLERLQAAGATRIVVNTCPFGEMMQSWAGSRPDVVLAPEPGGPYDTGGGLIAAAHLFREGGPIIVHAVDVLSLIPLQTLVAEHRAARQHLKDRLVATLAVQDRASSRRLLFDDAGLMGWVGKTGQRRVRTPAGAVRDVAFAGIHVVEPALFPLNERRGTFPIVELYLDLAERGYVIRPADVSRHEWLDVGTPEKLAAAEGGG